MKVLLNFFRNVLLILILLLDFLPIYTQSMPKLMLPAGHSESILEAQVSQDGKKIMSSDGRSIIIWELESGKILSEIISDGYAFENAQITHDGSLVVTSSANEFEVWDAISGVRIADYFTNMVIHYVKLSPDNSKVLIQEHEDGGGFIRAHLFDLVKGTLVASFKGYAVTFSPDGSKIAYNNPFISAREKEVAGEDYNHDVVIWDIATEKVIVKFHGDGDLESCNPWSEDGKYIIIDLEDIIKIFDALSLELICKINVGDHYEPRCVGNYLYVSSIQSDRVWDIEKGQCILTFNNDNSIEEISPDGTMLLMKGGELFNVLDRKSKIIPYDIDVLLNDWDSILVITSDSLLLIDSHSGVVLNSCKYNSGSDNGLSFVDYIDKKVIFSSDKVVAVWDLVTNNLFPEALHSIGSISSVEFIDSNLISVTKSAEVFYDDSVGHNNELTTTYIWDLNRGELVGTKKSFEYSTNRNTVTPNDPSDVFEIYPTIQQKAFSRIRNLLGHLVPNYSSLLGVLNHAVFRSNGSIGMFQYLDNSYIAWKVLKDRTCPIMIPARSHFEFTRDRNRLIIQTQNGEVSLWEMKNGKLLKIMGEQTLYCLDREQDIMATCVNWYSPIDTPNPGGVTIWSMADGSKMYTFKINSKNNVNADEVYWISAEFIEGTIKTVTQSKDKKSTYFELWDYKTGNRLDFYEEREPEDNQKLISSQSDKFLTYTSTMLNIWDLNSHRLIKSISDTNYLIKNAIISKTGDKLIKFTHSVNDSDSTFISIIDTENGGNLVTINTAEYTTPGIVEDFDFGERWKKEYEFPFSVTEDSKKILLNTYSGADGLIFDGENGNLIKALGEKSVYLSFSSFNQKIITQKSISHEVCIWDANSGELFLSLVGHQGSVEYAEYSRNGKLILTNGEVVNIWQAENGQLLHSFENEGFTSAQFCPTSRVVVLHDDVDSILRLVDVNTYETIMELSGITYGAIVSPDGKKLMTCSEAEIKIWDVLTGSLLHELNEEEVGNIEFSFLLSDAQFSPDSRMVLLGGSKIIDILTRKIIEINAQKVKFASDWKKRLTIEEDGSVALWLGLSNQKVFRLSGEYSDASLSPDGNYIVTHNDETIEIWDARTQKLKISTPSGEIDYRAIDFSSDGKKVVIAYDNNIYLWHLIKGELLTTYDCRNDHVGNAFFNRTGLKIIITGRYANIWDLKSGLLPCELNEFGAGQAYLGELSEDGKRAAIALDNNTVRIFDTENGKLLKNIKSKGTVLNIDFNQNRFISAENSLLSLQNIETGETIYSWLIIDSANYLVMHPDGYFDGTENARDYLYFTCQGEIVDFGQMRDALYVPKLADKIMRGAPINYPKLTELDICESLPIIKALEVRENYTLYEIRPRSLGLERVEVYINNKRVLTKSVDELSQNNSSYLYRLEKEVINQHIIPGQVNETFLVGVTRSKQGSEIKTRGIYLPVDKRSDQKPVIPRLYAIMIGVNEYKDPSLNLKYPVKDAINLGNALEKAAVKLLGRDNVIMYRIHSNISPESGFSTPEKEGIRKAFEEIGQKSRPEDLIFVFFAGHGEMEGLDGKMFTFLTADASVDNRIGISTRELQQWLSFDGPHKILANKTILIFDACNSGQATKDLAVLSRNEDESRRIRQVEDLKNKSGVFILAGSAPNQAAYEMPQFQQGLLTYSLLSVLKNIPEILDERRYLNVQKWFLESERFLKRLVESQGLKQDAQPFGTANIRVGIVDEEVTSSIQIQAGKPLVLCANVLEGASLKDNLKLKKLVNERLSVISENNDGKSFVFASQETSNANEINIFYQISGDTVACRVTLLKNSNTLHQAEISGEKSNIEKLVTLIVDEVLGYIQ